VDTITVTNPPKTFTAADMERARQEEKDKLYGRLTRADERVASVETELQRISRERDERKAAKEAAKAAKDAGRGDRKKAKAEAEMSARKLLQAKTQEFEQRFATLEEQRVLREAALAKEAEFAQLRAYIQERVNQERESIAPQLVDLISGDTREEVDASVELLKAKTDEILQSVAGAQTAARSQLRGTAPTGFTSAGPLDNEGNTQTLTPEQLKAMPMKQFAALRPQLLGKGANSTNRGLFD
jgi:hypothetical protein